jgi:hypothetical protein
MLRTVLRRKRQELSEQVGIVHNEELSNSYVVQGG